MIKGGDEKAVEAALREDPSLVTTAEGFAAGGGATALHWAAEEGLASVLRMLIAPPFSLDPLAVDDSGATALHFAAAEGKVISVRVLCELCAECVHALDESGESALHWAMMNGQRECGAELLRLGSCIDLQSKSGTTPLHYASLNHHGPCVALLVDRDADLTVQDEQGKTAQELAGNDDELLAYFDPKQRKLKYRLLAAEREIEKLQGQLKQLGHDKARLQKTVESAFRAERNAVQDLSQQKTIAEDSTAALLASRELVTKLESTLASRSAALEEALSENLLLRKQVSQLTEELDVSRAASLHQDQQLLRLREDFRQQAEQAQEARRELELERERELQREQEREQEQGQQRDLVGSATSASSSTPLPPSPDRIQLHQLRATFNNLRTLLSLTNAAVGDSYKQLGCLLDPVSLTEPSSPLHTLPPLTDEQSQEPSSFAAEATAETGATAETAETEASGATCSDSTGSLSK